MPRLLVYLAGGRIAAVEVEVEEDGELAEDVVVQEVGVVDEARPQRSSSSNRVRCCDGTLSQSCTYDSLHGCCSHHGGVC